MDAILKLATTILTILFTALSCIYFQHHFPSLKSTEDPIFEILDLYDVIHCPRNFSLSLFRDGTYFFHIQTRTDSRGMRYFSRCEMTLEESVPWQRDVPMQWLKNGSGEITRLRAACQNLSYLIKPTVSLSANDIVIKSHLGEEEIDVTETKDGLQEVEQNDANHASLFKGIFPGTLWCGFGNLADDIYHNLGEEEEIDRCCRTHDLCKPIIEPFITKYHHRNPSFFPISHCACDVPLYNCFRRINTTAANEIGRLFFNFARMRCFDFQLREVCTEHWLGMCWSRQLKCAAVVKDNPRY